ncbi:MAG: ligase-associated DNA damage response endonuclease PdeM [Paracoccaceae bacterium]
MNGYDFTLNGAALRAFPSGALWWPAQRLLAVSDLHLGKSERLARRGGAMLPPYDAQDTLGRLKADIDSAAPETVLCLGDSFDDLDAAANLPEAETSLLNRVMAGRQWIWIEGNHDPGPTAFGGTHLAVLRRGPLIFRHVAEADAAGEVSGHYHPKARLSAAGQSIARPCFLLDSARLILPAYGRYTGGLNCDDPLISNMMEPGALAILTGAVARPVPMPRR